MYHRLGMNRNDTKECSACKNKSYRITDVDSKEETFFELKSLVQVKDFVSVADTHMKSKLYLCSKCHHCDFYDAGSMYEYLD